MAKLVRSDLRVKIDTGTEYLTNVAADVVRRLRKKRCVVAVVALLKSDEDFGAFAAIWLQLEGLIKQQAVMGESFEMHVCPLPSSYNQDAHVCFTRTAR